MIIHDAEVSRFGRRPSKALARLLPWTLSALVFALVFSGVVKAQNPSPPPTASADTVVTRKLPKIRAVLNGESFDLEVAVSLEDQLRGLMYRDSLGEKSGMLFNFNPPRAVNFWMKNCRIPLDMVFIRAGTVANVVDSATPCPRDPCPVYASVYSVDTVIELPGGSVKKYVIQPGDHVQLVPATAKADPVKPESPQSESGPVLKLSPAASPPNVPLSPLTP